MDHLPSLARQVAVDAWLGLTQFCLSLFFHDLHPYYYHSSVTLAHACIHPPCSPKPEHRGNNYGYVFSQLNYNAVCSPGAFILGTNGDTHGSLVCTSYLSDVPGGLID